MEFSHDVVVIGSGFAGTAAAQYLHENNVDYIVLEAASFTGGRTQTIKLGGDDGIWVDTGACFIHGTRGNPLTDECIKHGIQFKAGESNAESLFFADNALSYTEQHKVRNEFLKRYKTAKQFLRNEYRRGNVSLSMEDGLQKILTQNPVEWSKDSPQQHYMDFYKWILEEYEGANWDEMSILQLEGGCGFEGGNVMLQNGYKELIECMQNDLNIRTSCEVKLIEYNGTTAQLTVKNNEAWQTYKCKFVICTVSMGILKDSLKVDPNMPVKELESGLLRWNPALPQWKLDSLNCYEIGLMNKVILQFDEQFWPDVSRITHVGREAGDFPWFNHLGTNPPSLLAWTACRFADKVRVEMESDEQVINHCMNVLRIAYPHAPEPTFSYVTRWRTNPFTRGSYTFIAKGATKEKADMLKLPIENVYFAGEAFAEDHIGCVHGAYITGTESAQTITSNLRRKTNV